MGPHNEVVGPVQLSTQEVPWISCANVTRLLQLYQSEILIYKP